MKLHTNHTMSFVRIVNNGVPKNKILPLAVVVLITFADHGGLLPSTSCNSSMTLQDMNPWSHLYACNSEFKLSEAEKWRRI
jgi:hypothetical protein